MTDFAEALRRIDARLHLPQPARSRVILELATDLEALYRHYLDTGLAEEEARLAALSDLDATDEVLTDLAEVHVSAVRRGMDRLVRQIDSGWTRALLLVVLAVVAGTAARVVLSPMFVEDAGLFLWPMGLCLLAGGATGGLLLMRLQRFDADDPAPARGPLDRIAVLLLGEGILALFGTWMELYWAVGRMVDDTGQITPQLFAWLVRGSALLSAGIAAALILAVVWFFASHRTAVIEDARAALLMTVPTLGSRDTRREVEDD